MSFDRNNPPAGWSCLDVERTARRIAKASRLLLVGSFAAYALALTLPALIVRQNLRGITWDITVTGAETLSAGGVLILQLATGEPTHASAIHYALGALNLIPVAALVLWKLNGRKLSHTLPAVLLVAGFAAWSMRPSAPEELATANEIWQILPGYHLWLGSLAGMSIALGIRWKSRADLSALWSERPSAMTSGWSLEPDNLVHLPSAVRSLCWEARRLRQSLEQDPLGEQATREAWHWRNAALELSEVDRTMLLDHNVQLEPAEIAIERFWDADADTSLAPLAQMDAALDHFLATATAQPAFTGFR